MSISRPQIIAIAACHTCCAAPGDPCLFAPCEDPERRKEAAGISHPARVKLARKKYDELLDNITL